MDTGTPWETAGLDTLRLLSPLASERENANVRELSPTRTSEPYSSVLLILTFIPFPCPTSQARGPRERYASTSSSPACSSSAQRLLQGPAYIPLPAAQVHSTISPPSPSLLQPQYSQHRLPKVRLTHPCPSVSPMPNTREPP